MIIHSLQLANEGIWTRFLHTEIDFGIHYNLLKFHLVFLFIHFSDEVLHNMHMCSICAILSFSYLKHSEL